MSEVIKICIPAHGLATGTPITMEASGYKGPVCATAMAKFKLGETIKAENTAEFYEAPLVTEQHIVQEGH